MRIRAHFANRTAARDRTGARAPRALPKSLMDGPIRSAVHRCGTQVGADEVYAALLALASPENEDTGPPSSHPSPPRRPVAGQAAASACRECGGYLLLDATNGTHVCEDCALCQVDPVFGVGFEAGAPVQRPASPVRDDSAHGLPQWVRLLAEGDRGDTTRQDKVAEWVRHLGPYSGLAPCDIDEACCITSRRRLAMYKPEVVAMAAIVLLSVTLPESARMEDAMRARRAMPSVAPRMPAPLFPCAQCGRMCHDLKSSRYHCKPWGVKRRRRG